MGTLSGVSSWVVGVPAGCWWGYRESLGPNALIWAQPTALAAAKVALGSQFQHPSRWQTRAYPKCTGSRTQNVKVY